MADLAEALVIYVPLIFNRKLFGDEQKHKIQVEHEHHIGFIYVFPFMIFIMTLVFFGPMIAQCSLYLIETLFQHSFRFQEI